MRFALLLLVFLGNLPAVHAQTRQIEDQQAKDAFKNLNFFAGGRGMIMSPNLIRWVERFKGAVTSEAESRWGLTVVDGEIPGLFNVRYRNFDVGVVGCVVCHSGKVAGQYVVGLGNKNIDVLKMAQDLNRIERIWKKSAKPARLKSPDYVAVEEAAMEFSHNLAKDDIGNLSQGLVPVSFIRSWFYRVLGEPVPEQMKRGQVKVPALWGYGEKRPVGQFSDGFGDGEFPGWAVAVELTAGQTAEGVRSYQARLEEAEGLFSKFLPPPYPFPIRRDLAQTGHQIFNRTCANCHGTYEVDREGLPIYQAPLWIPIEIAGTDSDRVDGNTPEFVVQVARNPLSDIIRVKSAERGYFAQRLVGIWARFPYLHNGSVPTIRDLLSPAASRPIQFSLREAGEADQFDPVKLGVRMSGNVEDNPGRDVYDVTRIGHSNQGHEFYTGLSEAEKTALIEYLKTL